MKQKSADLIKERSTKWIIDALLKLMSKYQYEEITVTMICSEADLTRQTFYRLFSSKDDVVREYLKGVFKGCYKKLEETNSNDLRVLLKAYFDFWKDNEELIDFLYKHNLQSNSLSCNRLLVGSIEKHLDKNLSPYERDVLAGALFAVSEDWFENGMKEDTTTLVDGMSNCLNV